MMDRPWHFWIDRGGTFTDLVGCSPQGRLVVRKVLSEPPTPPTASPAIDPAIGALRQVLGLADGGSPPDGLRGGGAAGHHRGHQCPAGAPGGARAAAGESWLCRPAPDRRSAPARHLRPSDPSTRAPARAGDRGGRPTGGGREELEPLRPGWGPGAGPGAGLGRWLPQLRRGPAAQRPPSPP